MMGSSPNDSKTLKMGLEAYHILYIRLPRFFTSDIFNKNM